MTVQSACEHLLKSGYVRTGSEDTLSSSRMVYESRNDLGEEPPKITAYVYYRGVSYDCGREIEMNIVGSSGGRLMDHSILCIRAIELPKILSKVESVLLAAWEAHVQLFRLQKQDGGVQ